MMRIGLRIVRTSPMRARIRARSSVNAGKPDAVGLTEVRRVGGVESFRAELELDLFGDLEVLEQRKVQVALSRRVQDVVPALP